MVLAGQLPALTSDEFVQFRDGRSLGAVGAEIEHLSGRSLGEAFESQAARCAEGVLAATAAFAASRTVEVTSSGWTMNIV